MGRRREAPEKYDPPRFEWDDEVDDKVAFEKAMSEVSRIDPGPKRASRRMGERVGLEGAPFEEKALEKLMAQPDASTPLCPDHIEGTTRRADEHLLEGLRNGNYSIQAHLDLHGLTRQDAREAVEGFILKSVRGGISCVRIVHGVGRHSDRQVPVLRDSLKAWFRMKRFARYVVAFCSARPADGGLGAVYVLLKRGK